MTDSITKIRGLCHDIKRRDEELRRSFLELEQTLSAAIEGVEVHGTSINCSLETYGDDEAIYGYLFFNRSGLQVAHRSTEEDMSDALNNDIGDPVYSVKNLQKCPIAWLSALAAPSIIESLLESLTETAQQSIRATTQGVRVLAATANLPVRTLESAIISAAESLSYQVVLQVWSQAQAALGVDPADAATRACSLLESLCKHILQTLGQPLPADQSIQKLFKATAKSLHLSPDQQSAFDLQMIGSGIFSIAHGVGSLRTHSGTAHGGDANRHTATFPEARLAVNSAGAVATFLMETLVAQQR